MWGTILALGGQIVSGVASAIGNKRKQAIEEQASAREIAYNEAKANANPLADSNTQYLLNKYDRDAEAALERAKGTSAITGATPEYTLGVQKGLAEGKADLMSGISAKTTERADKYKDAAEKARMQANTNRVNTINERMQTYANLAANAMSAGAKIIDGYGAKQTQENDSGNQGKKKEPEKTEEQD